MVINNTVSMILEVLADVSFFGYMIAYIIIIGSNTNNFMSTVFGVEISPTYYRLGITILIVYPLTFMKSLKSMSKVSIISSIAIFITIITVIAYYFANLSSRQLCMKPNGTAIEYRLQLGSSSTGIDTVLGFLMYIPAISSMFLPHA